MKDEVEILIGWRKRRRLSQSKAALIIGVSVDTLRKWEQRAYAPGGLARATIWAKCK